MSGVDDAITAAADEAGRPFGMTGEEELQSIVMDWPDD